MGIGGVIRDHSGTVLRAFSSQAGVGLAIEVGILALSKGFFLQAKAFGLSTLTIEGDSTTVISKVINKERS